MDQEKNGGQIEQMIDEEKIEEQEQNFDFACSIENNSYNVEGSKVIFPRQGIILTQKGASLAETQISVSPELIKEGEIIGQGTAGSVYIADYVVNGKNLKVAIKQIPLQGSKSVRDQFFNDLRVFLKVNSQYLVKFYGCYYKEGYLHEIIQYMDLGSLRDLIRYFSIKKQLLVEPVLAHFSKCILQGLFAIHKLKQIHRDIKPENILVNSKGDVKITDFGVSKALDKTFGLAKTPIGTIIYMSPERMNIDGHTYNCDVWSFGLVLYQLATLRQSPYVQGQNQVQYALIKRIQQSPPPKFSPQDQRTPQFNHFLTRCLQKDFKYRANVQELLNHNWLKSQTKQIPDKQFKMYMRQLAKEMKK